MAERDGVSAAGDFYGSSFMSHRHNVGYGKLDRRLTGNGSVTLLRSSCGSNQTQEAPLSLVARWWFRLKALGAVK